jgi:hypothetical protein
VGAALAGRTRLGEVVVVVGRVLLLLLGRCRCRRGVPHLERSGAPGAVEHVAGAAEEVAVGWAGSTARERSCYTDAHLRGKM